MAGNPFQRPGVWVRKHGAALSWGAQPTRVSAAHSRHESAKTTEDEFREVLDQRQAAEQKLDHRI